MWLSRRRALAALAVAVFTAGACGTGSSEPPEASVPVDARLPIDLADGPAGPDLWGTCQSDADCAGRGHCDGRSHRCVECIVDGDCPAGALCVAEVCRDGCSALHGCGDAGACEHDAGGCVECLVDTDCRGAGRCAPDHRCAPCLPDGDNCPLGEFCAPSGATYACLPGCRRDADCAVFADGGAGLRCDAASHRCVACLDDTDCAPGTTCQMGACAPGCNALHDCGGLLACCAARCADPASDVNHCGGCGIACPPGWACCAAACIDTRSDPAQCGACGHRCPVGANMTAACKMALCSAACSDGWADCNHDLADGCEVGLRFDPHNCGACGVACSLPHAGAACVASACAVAACDPGFRNCNGDPKDGCEVDILDDVANCGGCGSNCKALPHATAGCVHGGCVISACDAGWGNCDKVDGNGCETDLSSTPADCGGCGMACPAPPHIQTFCMNTMCSSGACEKNYADCNGDPADGCEAALLTDAASCGACGTVCPGHPHAGGACTMGACGLACDPGWGDCDGKAANGCETNLNSDDANCGACKNGCAMGQACVMGTCGGLVDGGGVADLAYMSDL